MIRPLHRLTRPIVSLLILTLLGGCILAEDPESFVIRSDASGGGDGLGDGVADVPLPPCSVNNPRSCGLECVDCLALPGVGDADCAAGACKLVACTPGLLDCDGLMENGCEQQESARVCGASCVDCLERPGALDGECVEGACVLTCEAGLTDCDGSVQSGCEQPESINACGGACVDCSTLEAVSSASCAEGLCAIDACAYGRLDCNGEAEDGCESPYDDQACGADCGVDCTTLAQVAQGRCAGEGCAIVACEQGWRDDDLSWEEGCEAPCGLGECWALPPRGHAAMAWFPGHLDGVMVGDRGEISVTTDGGLTWHRRVSGATTRLRAAATDGRGVALVLGADGTLLRSEDRGATWSLIPLPTVGATLNAVAADGDLAVIVGEGALLLSRDAGERWEDASARLVPAGLDLRAAHVEGARVIVAGADGQLMISQDAGVIFSPLTLASASTIRFIIAVAGDGLYMGGNAFLLRSTTGGASWEAQEVPDSNWQQADALDGELLLVAPGAFARSGPEGLTRTLWSDAVPLAAGALRAEGSLLLVGADAEGFGHRFEVAPEGAMIEETTLARAGREPRWLVESGALLLAGGDGGGLLRSVDNGATWSWRVVDWSAADAALTHGALQDQRALAAVSGSLPGIALSEDGGETWREVWSDAQGTAVIHAIDLDGDVGLAAGARAGSPTLWRSEDGGASWQELDCGATGIDCAMLTSSAAISLAIEGSRAALGGDDGELLLSEDGGLTWSPLLRLPGEGPVRTLRLVGDAITALLGASGAPSRIFHSPDVGASWAGGATPAFDTAGVGGATLHAWAWRGDVAVAVGSRGHVVRSEDGGAQWTLHESGVDADLRHVVARSDWIIAANNTGTLARSEDGGETFTRGSLELLGGALRGLALDNQRVIGVASHGQVLISHGAMSAAP